QIISTKLELKNAKDMPHYSFTENAKNIENVDRYFDSLSRENAPTIQELKALKEEISNEIHTAQVKNEYLITDLFPKLEKEIQAAN
ncbi:MAG: hypothetical protein ACI4JY_10820, partial [Oscillospiraceae bacterium]